LNRFWIVFHLALFGLTKSTPHPINKKPHECGAFNILA